MHVWVHFEISPCLLGAEGRYFSQVRWWHWHEPFICVVPSIMPNTWPARGILMPSSAPVQTLPSVRVCQAPTLPPWTERRNYGQQCPCCFACAWLSCIVMDNGRWRFSSQNTPVFLCWQEWFPAQWIAQAQKRTTENYIESLLQIWSIAVRR